MDSSQQEQEIAELWNLEHSSMHSTNAPVFLQKAIGAELWDVNGRTWVDFSSSVAVANAGHANQEIIDSIKNALDAKLLATYSFPHRERLKLYKNIRDILYRSTNNDYKVHFMSSGTEAIEAAIEIAHNQAKKSRVVLVSFFNAFHGNTLGAKSLSGQSPFSTYDNKNGTQICFIKLPYIQRQSQSSSSFEDSLAIALKQYDLRVDEVAAIVIEPYQGRGVFVADSKFFGDVDNFCKKNNALLIVDEIQSGFYRTGLRFAFEHYKVSPDIICIGKGLTSSLPMSGIAVKSLLFDSSQNLDIATTHSANPISCAAANASIDFLERLYSSGHITELSKQMFARTKLLQNKYAKYISHADSFGMVMGIQLAKGGEPSPEYAKTVVQYCFENGLIVSGPNGSNRTFIRITPPLTISSHELEKGFLILEAAMGALR